MVGYGKKRRRIIAIAKGRVQGVGYRAFCADHAMRLNIDGYVRNLNDGRVELVAECDEGTLRHVVELMREGPAFSRVEDVTFRWEEPTGEYRGFEAVI
ncbi:MAG: acylphosphatase [Chloroflexi bacterium]|nr:acylphosphatase [Chloroflexota bacterium]MDA1146491.1 acylphosphatase [Chloroflexota bacterium]